MHKHSRHTASLLLLVIVYPFLFQTLHIIRHDHDHYAGHSHMNGRSNKTNCSSLSGFCGNIDGHADDHPSEQNCDKKLDHRDILYIVTHVATLHDHEECPLCV